MWPPHFVFDIGIARGEQRLTKMPGAAEEKRNNPCRAYAQMKYLKHVFPLLLAACSIDPAATNDNAGLGTSKLATQLKYSMFLGETAVDRTIADLVNVPRVLDAADRRAALNEFGFTCPAPPAAVCTYDGSAKSVIVSADRKDTQKFTTKVHIQARLENHGVDINSRLQKIDF
jgi:hypothetical protein